MSEISIRLGLLRVARGLTQQQLADATELRRDTISALERGKSQGITFDTLRRLCDALNCTPNDILALSETAHIVPVLGGEDEDEIIAERLAAVDLDALAANPALAGAGLDYGTAVQGGSAEAIALASLASTLPIELLHAIDRSRIARTYTELQDDLARHARDVTITRREGPTEPTVGEESQQAIRRRA